MRSSSAAQLALDFDKPRGPVFPIDARVRINWPRQLMGARWHGRHGTVRRIPTGARSDQRLVEIDAGARDRTAKMFLFDIKHLEPETR